MPAKKPRAAPSPPDWMQPAEIAAVKEALARRSRFRDGPGAIDLVQTHISTVFLTPRHVFKFKRPLDVGFADFRTLASRKHFCREELTLNRRLAPDVYLAVVPLRREQGRYTFGARGPVVDYAVAMRRLPAEGMLDARLRAGTVAPEDMDRLAEFIAVFHRRLRPARRFSHIGAPATWRRNWAENFQQTEPLTGQVLSAAEHAGLRTAVDGFLRRNRGRLRARVTGGFIRNGHGDLRCEHIELARRIRIIDCVEFTERFRYGDVANDLAFLLMDLCVFGRPDLARRLLERYAAVTGDRTMLPLIPFYACYRATVRAKVLGMRLQDRNFSRAARADVTARARRFVSLAQSFARQMGPPVLLIAAGLMGSGKSHLANAVAERTGMAVLASDRIRKELAYGKAAEPRRDRSGFGGGIYTLRWTERTYREMFRRAQALLSAGRSVILDATFSRQAQRSRAFALAKRWGAEAWFAECRVPDAVALARLRRRELRGTGISDGRAELYPSQKAAFEPVAGLPPERCIVIDTDQPKDRPPAQLLATPGLRIPAPLFHFASAAGPGSPTEHRPPRAGGPPARPD
jgi:hypothetical protein